MGVTIGNLTGVFETADKLRFVKLRPVGKNGPDQGNARKTLERGITHQLATSPNQLIEQACERASALLDIDLPAYRINKLILRNRAFERAVEVAKELASEAPTGNPFEKLRR